jgi:hypothetical protein
MYQVVHNEPEPPHNLNKNLPEAVDRAVLKGMAKKIEDRYASCADLAKAVTLALEGGDPVEAESGSQTSPAEMQTVALRADEVLLENKPVPTRSIEEEAATSKPWLGIAAAVVAVALAGFGIFSWFGGESETTEEAAIAAGLMTASFEVVSNPPGAEIWVNGIDQHLTTPAFVSLKGPEGEVSELELRREGAVLANIQFVLGGAIPNRWAPELLPAPERWNITSEPAGAKLFINDEAYGTTPADFVFSYDDSYEVRVEMDGFDSAGRTIALAEMDDAARSGKALNLRLPKIIPPGFLVIKASYPVTVTVDGRRKSGSRISLRPGSYQVGLSAPEAFYSGSRSVTIRTGESSAISLPATTPVTIAATPSNCKIRINGRDAGFVPVNVQLAIGRHEIEFLWEAMGKSLTVTEDVGTGTKRIFKAAPSQ